MIEIILKGFFTASTDAWGPSFVHYKVYNISGVLTSPWKRKGKMNLGHPARSGKKKPAA
jgi:hypothetical protein